LGKQQILHDAGPRRILPRVLKLPDHGGEKRGAICYL
jgi:hypothetical protein